MSSDLSPSSEAFLHEAVARGCFPSRSDALEAAVELLRRQQIIDKLAEGRRQLDEGEYVEFDEAGLREYFDTLLDGAAQRKGLNT
jgi:Arc/MetJ-type ribon-helix-helix transcriptional regulator